MFLNFFQKHFTSATNVSEMLLGLRNNKQPYYKLSAEQPGHFLSAINREFYIQHNAIEFSFVLITNNRENTFNISVVSNIVSLKDIYLV